MLASLKELRIFYNLCQCRTGYYLKSRKCSGVANYISHFLLLKKGRHLKNLLVLPQWTASQMDIYGYNEVVAEARLCLQFTWFPDFKGSGNNEIIKTDFLNATRPYLQWNISTTCSLKDLTILMQTFPFSFKTHSKFSYFKRCLIFQRGIQA